MTEWSIAPPVDCSLSLTITQIRIPVLACEKVASDLGLCGGFAGHTGFLYLKRISHNMA